MAAACICPTPGPCCQPPRTPPALAPGRAPRRSAGSGPCRRCPAMAERCSAATRREQPPASPPPDTPIIPPRLSALVAYPHTPQRPLLPPSCDLGASSRRRSTPAITNPGEIRGKKDLRVEVFRCLDATRSRVSSPAGVPQTPPPHL